MKYVVIKQFSYNIKSIFNRVWMKTSHDVIITFTPDLKSSAWQQALPQHLG